MWDRDRVRVKTVRRVPAAWPMAWKVPMGRRPSSCLRVSPGFSRRPSFHSAVTKTLPTRTVDVATHLVGVGVGVGVGVRGWGLGFGFGVGVSVSRDAPRQRQRVRHALVAHRVTDAERKPQPEVAADLGRVHHLRRHDRRAVVGRADGEARRIDIRASAHRLEGEVTAHKPGELLDRRLIRRSHRLHEHGRTSRRTEQRRSAERRGIREGRGQREGRYQHGGAEGHVPARGTV